MDDRHLMNTIRMLERKKETADAALDSYGTARGDMATYYEDQGVMGEGGFVMPPAYDALIQEAKRRKLKLSRWCVTCQQVHRQRQKTCDVVQCGRCGKTHPAPINEYHERALRCGVEEGALVLREDGRVCVVKKVLTVGGLRYACKERTLHGQPFTVVEGRVLTCLACIASRP